MMETEITGLTEAEAQEKNRREQDGAPRRSITKSTGQIIRESVFTLFKLFARAYSNLLFIAIIFKKVIANF